MSFKRVGLEALNGLFFVLWCISSLDGLFIHPMIVKL